MLQVVGALLIVFATTVGDLAAEAAGIDEIRYVIAVTLLAVGASIAVIGNRKRSARTQS